MRGLIDATALGSGRGGDETMLRGIVRGLALVAAGDDRFTVLADPSEGTDRSALLDGQPGPAITVAAMARRPGAVHFSTELPWSRSR